MSTHTGPPSARLPAVLEARWENQGGAVRPPAHVAAAALVRARQDRLAAGPQTEQPRLYVDLLAEADRLVGPRTPSRRPA